MSDPLVYLKRGLLFHRIAALVLLLIVGHQNRADMREQFGDADLVLWKKSGRAYEAAVRRELGPRRSA